MDSFMKEFEHLKIQLTEIKSATHNFHQTKVIGSGGFGKVYKGDLSHSKGRGLVAFKCLDRQYGQGTPEFWKEIMTLSRYSHENLISLLGFCDEDNEKILVYEYASNGSLDRHLNNTELTWSQRIKICLKAARGLCYLHEDNGAHQRVLHRDIKSANILLDDEWNAKVADMGLSKLGPANQKYMDLVTGIVGTIGYLDPMYLQMGLLTKESDVYSFGVVLMEVLCGKLCFHIENGTFSTLVHTWKQSYKKGKLEEIIFQGVMQPMDVNSLRIFSKVAFECLNKHHEGRPSMSFVVKELKTALELQEPHDLKLPKEYEEILKAAVSPIQYKSIIGFEKHLFDGIFLNGGKTWFSLNDKKEHHVLMSITECLIPYKGKDVSTQFSTRYNSRFKECLYMYTTNVKDFITRVRSQFLLEGTTYSVNLVFKYVRDKNGQKLCEENFKYKLDGEEEAFNSCLVI
ncbi:probable serine/threonine-protein kinase PBL28 [Rutidosis leptorrhynchoides]|uniref:probable serine/threonine-protein kinase PBL28 n=1 Tax=Rutidosis leptorrhynchoides TaxID=125765 RepID=UPI003A99903B